MQKLKQYLLDWRFILIIYCLITVGASLQSYFQGPKDFGDGIINTHYNNYVIFKYSFFHLIHNQDLYSFYPQEHWDLFKYSPAFALFMGTIAYMPDAMGLILWNLLNALVLFVAFKQLPNIGEKNKAFMLWFVLLELLTATQSEQSNGLMAGLIILAFVMFERKKVFWASLFIMLSVFIKLFGLVAFALFLLYPDKIKFILSSVFWFLFLVFIPIIVWPLSQFEFLYASWANLLSNDHSASIGISVMGIINNLMGINISKNLILLTGVFIFCLPLLKIKNYKDYGFRILMLASVLIWVIIFNHKAESPTFVIAICGAALWYFPQIRKTENLILIILAFVFTSLSVTDAFPRFLRKEFFEPYLIKVIPCILIWLKLVYELLLGKYELEEAAPANE